MEVSQSPYYAFPHLGWSRIPDEPPSPRLFDPSLARLPFFGSGFSFEPNRTSDISTFWGRFRFAAFGASMLGACRTRWRCRRRCWARRARCDSTFGVLESVLGFREMRQGMAHRVIPPFPAEKQATRDMDTFAVVGSLAADSVLTVSLQEFWQL